MTDTANKSSGLRAFLTRTLADPVLLYTVLLIMSIMHHYRSSRALAYGLAAYLIGWVVFRIFDFVYKHHIIGFFACIILYYISARSAYACMDKGSENYPISWGLWFFTPQNALRYNKWYTLAIFILFLIFMLSVVYYFTRVRYRIFMNFLIFIIPFTIYGKEYEKMPIGYIIALAVGYVLMMVMFRQLRESEKDVFVNRGEAWKSVAVFTVLFALFSTLFPKPVVHEDRTILETLINADALTDRLNQMLDVFRDTSTGEQFRTRQSDVIHYIVEADDAMRLKTATFSTYDFKRDEWKASDIDTYYRTYTDPSFDINFNAETADAVFFAAKLDYDFAKKYGLVAYAGKKLEYPQKKKAVIFPRYGVMNGAETIPVPQGATALTESDYKNKIALSRAGAVFTVDDQYYTNETFTFEYIPNTAFPDSNKELIQVLADRDDYSLMLKDAYDALDIWRPNEETKHYRSVINFNEAFYDSYTELLLDYGNDEKIYELAQQITAGCETEYDKAKEIEWYFISNGFKYDLDYQKAQGENVHDFLFRTKTGVCVEYATAMVMLSRAAGIPARYCEGYLMQNEIEDADVKSYRVTANDGHAFPELYIKGYGWMTFEPTMSNMINSTANKTTKVSTTDMLKKAGFVMLVISAGMLLLLVVMPYLTHKLFMLINRKREPDKAVAAVMHRLCKLYGIDATNTAGEAAQLIAETSGADISAVKELFSKSAYGSIPMSEADRDKAMADYLAAYEALKESKRKKRRIKISPHGGN
ncbi:Transglutaminase-like enzyme, putative cysteine protease [Ruminococcus sp. YRD2003]|uniref:transglutaminase-like domain-containing protein n=1 Tax=Ruminococcus sp. YRD2003 TaxID=1452313 RepID=UPI0008D3C23A|nr:Transglutaminase-like enzyme, putative cysteine protease [Ruminococcus flavefaciens]